jgi:hypothetical protein
MIKYWLLAVQEISFQTIHIRCNGPLKQNEVKLKGGRGLGESKPGSRRKKGTLEHKEIELLRKTKEEEAWEG